MGIIWRRICQVLKNKIWKYTGGPGRLATYEAAYAKQQFFEDQGKIAYESIHFVGDPYASQKHLIILKPLKSKEEDIVEPEHH